MHSDQSPSSARLLLDNNLPPKLAALLNLRGHDAVHARSYDLQNAPDLVVFERAAAEGRILVSADTDFGAILAIGNRRKPSFILLREVAARRAEDYLSIILELISTLQNDVERGCVVVIRRGRVRLRYLPLFEQQPHD